MSKATEYAELPWVAAVLMVAIMAAVGRGGCAFLNDDASAEERMRVGGGGKVPGATQWLKAASRVNAVPSG